MGNTYVGDRSAIKIDIETVSGVYQAPTIVLPLEKGAGVWEPALDKDEANPIAANHGSKETTLITAFASVSASSKMKLPSDHTLVAAAFECCGVVGTAITSVGTGYAYDSAKKSTASMLQMGERKSTLVYGARSDFGLVCEIGKAAEISFDFKSTLKEVVQLDSGDADNTIPDTPGFEKVFMTKDCAAYLVNGNTAHFKKVAFNLGAEVVVPKDTCSGAAYTKDIKPELQVTMSVTEDNEDAFIDLKSGTEFNFVIPLFDVHGVEKWQLIAPKCVVIDQKTPVNEGRIDVDRTLECRKTAGDDNWELRAIHA